MTTQELIPGFRADLQAIIEKYPELESLMLAGVIYLGLDNDDAVALNLAVKAPPERILEHAILWMRERANLDSSDDLAGVMASPHPVHIHNDVDITEIEDKDKPDRMHDKYNYPHSVQVFIDRERARMHQRDY
jgi:hypothetical protein